MNESKIVRKILLLTFTLILAFSILNNLSNLRINLIEIPIVSFISFFSLFILSIFLKVKRTQILIKFIKPNSFFTNLQGLSLGYLANLLIPFRLGEIIRGYFLARKLEISFGFTLGTITLDRGLDLIIISILLFLNYSINGFERVGIFSVPDLVVISSGTFVFIFTIMTIIRTKLLLRIIHKFTSMFNSATENKLKNSVWGLILSYQQLRQDHKLARKYLLLVISSWIVTFSALLVLITVIQNATQPSVKILEYVPFLAYVVLNGNDLFTNYSTKIKGLEDIISSNADNFLNNFASFSWLVYTAPYLLIGLTTLLTIICAKKYENTKYRRNRETLTQKTKPVAPSQFLESFFMKERVIENIHQKSVTENYEILEYFKGGSDAVTMLVQKSEGKVVHKVVGTRGREKLINQGQWLRGIQSKGIVKFIDSRADKEFYEIEMEYIDNSISFFNFIHLNHIEVSKRVILHAMSTLTRDVWGIVKEKDISFELANYLQHNFHEKIAELMELSHKFSELVNRRLPCMVNGKQYYDLKTIMELILQSEKCIKKLTFMRTSEKCHGDFTVDNILVQNSTNSTVLIDPSDDNQIRGPLIDLSRLMQSFLGGYEFLNADDSIAVLKFETDLTYINYIDSKSSKYLELSDWLYNDLFPNVLAKDEIASIKFHVGILYVRMLTHKFLINEEIIFKYFAVAIQLLNEFYQDIYETNT